MSQYAFCLIPERKVDVETSEKLAVHHDISHLPSHCVEPIVFNQIVETSHQVSQNVSKG
jgi:hypothetical protein